MAISSRYDDHLTEKNQAITDLIRTEGFENAVYGVSAYYYGCKLTLDGRCLTASQVRHLKKLFGSKDDTGTYSLRISGSSDEKSLFGSTKLAFVSDHENTISFNLDLEITSYLTCEQIDVSKGLSDEEWRNVRKRIEQGEIPITVCARTTEIGEEE